MALQTYRDYFAPVQDETGNLLQKLMQIKEFKAAEAERNRLGQVRQMAGQYATSGDQNALTKLMQADPATGMQMQNMNRERQALDQKEQEQIQEIGKRYLVNIDTDDPKKFKESMITNGMAAVNEISSRFGDKALPEMMRIKTYVDHALNDDPNIMGFVGAIKQSMIGPEVAKTKAIEGIKSKAQAEQEELKFKNQKELTALKAGLDLKQEDRKLEKQKELKSYEFGLNKNLESFKADLKGKEGNVNFKDETTLRKEYATQAKDFIGVKDAYLTVLANSSDPSAAGDIGLIFSIMKMFDPASTVREGEFATASQAGGVPDRIVSQYNKLVSGERLSGAQRTDFANTAKRTYDKRLQDNKRLKAQYNRLAEKYGFDPSNITIDYEAEASQFTPVQARQSFAPTNNQTPKRIKFDAQGNIIQ